MINTKPCPFCGSTDIRYSVKNAPDRVDHNFNHFKRYYLAMYCFDCHCYGKRVLLDEPNVSRYTLSRDEKYEEMAKEAWNHRVPEPF